jgi:hypothetical protein
MADTWESVAAKPEFQALPPDQQIAASKQYFDTVVKPQVPPEHLDDAMKQFTSHVAETSPRSFMESMGARAGTAMEAQPHDLPSMVRKKLLGFDPVTGMERAAGVVASPFGAAGENLERRAGQAVGLSGPGLEKAARATGDVSESLAGILPGPKLAKGAEAVGEGVAAAGKNISAGAGTMKEGFHARTPEVLAQATENIAKEGDAAFKDMRASGVSLNPQIAHALTDHMQSAVNEMGVLNPKIHGDTISILKQMKQESQKGMSIDRLHQYRKLLRGAQNKELRAGNDEGAKAAGNALNALDEAVETVKVKGGSAEGSKALQSMQNGIKTWAKMRKFDTISDAIERSAGDPDKLKTALKKIHDSPKLSRGFNKEEMAALKEASQNTTSESLLKMAGKFGFDISKGVAGNKAPFWTGVGAHLMGAPSPAVVAATAAGTAGRYGQKLMARGKAEKLLQTIEGGKSADAALGAETDPLTKRISP